MDYISLDEFINMKIENPFADSKVLEYRHLNSYRKQLLDVWGEMNSSVELYKMFKKKKASEADLIAQLDSFHRCCYVVYSDEKNSNGLKWELKVAEWELYDFLLWKNEFHNSIKSVTLWFDQWCYSV